MANRTKMKCPQCSRTMMLVKKSYEEKYRRIESCYCDICDLHANITIQEYYESKGKLPPNMKRVNKYYNKAPKELTCPNCGDKRMVYHFSWVASICPNCKMAIKKTDYLIEVV